MTRNYVEPALGRVPEVAATLRSIARPLVSDADLDPLMERIGNAHYVLLGEATHGTSEFYSWRARLSERLIREKGFSFIAVEGDWPDAHRLDRYIHGQDHPSKNARDVLMRMARWPTWMWANREVASFADRLRAYTVAGANPISWYGLDVYSLWSSMTAVIGYLDSVDPEAAQIARRSYECFAPYGQDEQAYARATVLVPHHCREEVVRVLATLVGKAGHHVRVTGREAQFDAEQNAIIAKNAEHYYRTMVGGGAASWNIRDDHMVETLDRLMTFHAPDAKCIVWEHNTHVGDARFTDMVEQGEHNVGQLVREARGEDDVVIVGFSTHRGSVIAGRTWDAPFARMRVCPAREGSFEDAIHRGIGTDALLLFDEVKDSEVLSEPRGHRAIGVVYHPEYERFGNYVPTVLPRRYDALIHIEETHALSPLHPEHPALLVPETFPSGM